MPEHIIAIIPNLGYHPARQYSIKACRWLAWEGREKSIRHAKNGGEVRLGNFTVDGYDEVNNTVYEFHGCYWHGCPICYPDRVTDILITLIGLMLQFTSKLYDGKSITR